MICHVPSPSSKASSFQHSCAPAELKQRGLRGVKANWGEAEWVELARMESWNGMNHDEPMIFPYF